MSTRVHGALDYFLAIVLASLPWWAGNHRGGAETWIPIGVAIGVVLVAATTDYALSVVHVLPMPIHLGLDTVAGVFLAAAPWVFRFADLSAKPYFVLGIVLVCSALCTRGAPDPARPGAKSPPIGNLG